MSSRSTAIKKVAALLKGTEARLKSMWSCGVDELNCNLGSVSVSISTDSNELKDLGRCAFSLMGFGDLTSYPRIMHDFTMSCEWWR